MHKKHPHSTKRKPNLVLYLVLGSMLLLLLSLLFSRSNASRSQGAKQNTVVSITPIRQDNLTEEEIKTSENHEPYEEPSAE